MLKLLFGLTLFLCINLFAQNMVIYPKSGAPVTYVVSEVDSVIFVANTSSSSISTPSSSSSRTSSSSVSKICENGSLTDPRDQKTYKCTTIGSQVWMTENLNFLPAGKDGSGAYCYGSNATIKATNCNSYGRLYDWNTAMNGEASSIINPSGVQGICPEGWHIPSDIEWTALADYIDLNNGTEGIGKNLKANSSLWNPNTGNDPMNFNALPAGNYTAGSFSLLGTWAFFWSTAESDANNAYYRYLNAANDIFGRYSHIKTNAFSVRCIQN